VKLLLFDIDGTLILTGGAGVRALNRAFSKLFAIEDAMRGVSPHGKTDPFIIREVFAKCAPSLKHADFIEDILHEYLRFLSEEVAASPAYSVLPGIEEFLSQFSGRRDLGFALATGNIEAGARIKLERGNLNRYFRSGGFGSDSENRAELVRCAAIRAARECQISAHHSDTFVIGDTPRDIEAGREAGFRTVGVATSKYSVSDLEAAGADLAIPNFLEGRDQFLRLTRIL
jgi:phosphoglycolate phosphatase-like HAD superfamily hydrolase